MANGVRVGRYDRAEVVRSGRSRWAPPCRRSGLLRKTRECDLAKDWCRTFCPTGRGETCVDASRSRTGQSPKGDPSLSTRVSYFRIANERPEKREACSSLATMSISMRDLVSGDASPATKRTKWRIASTDPPRCVGVGQSQSEPWIVIQIRIVVPKITGMPLSRYSTHLKRRCWDIHSDGGQQGPMLRSAAANTNSYSSRPQ